MVGETVDDGASAIKIPAQSFNDRVNPPILKTRRKRSEWDAEGDLWHGVSGLSRFVLSCAIVI
jgi:hypothetical protein